MCVACSVGSVFFLKTIVARILRSVMSASALTATVAGWPGAGRNQTSRPSSPELTTGILRIVCRGDQTAQILRFQAASVMKPLVDLVENCRSPWHN